MSTVFVCLLTIYLHTLGIKDEKIITLLRSFEVLLQVTAQLLSVKRAETGELWTINQMIIIY